MQPKVSIIGAGPAGFALAADLQRHGKRVLVYSHPTHLRHANGVREKGHLQANGVMECSTTLPVTSDMGEAVAFSRILILTVPSTGQETVLQELKKFALHRHTIVAVPGNLFSLVAAAELDAECILETNLSPYSCRMEEGGLLTVMGRKKRIFIAPLSHSQQQQRGQNQIQKSPNLGGAAAVTTVVYDKMRSLFPMELRWCSSVVEVCLCNVNGVFHPLMMLMNAGRIESQSTATTTSSTTGSGDNFLLYRDGLTRSVANAMLAVDRVRMRIGEAFGLRLPSAVQISNECYGQAFADFVDLARNSPPHNRLRAPSTLENRNLSEDVPDLLVTWCCLAEKLGIDASPIRAVIVLVGMATGVDYFAIGRNLQRLHLDDVSADELVARFSPGGAHGMMVDCGIPPEEGGKYMAVL
ncbi:6-phosphogluconate dehydrogenase [Chaetomium strumarium]|uniref:6-phosphogluconate dehydrogenase n=1 Tax=Chaetomium strumarium TaxID=1170767 RepID=A0AAJ0GXZ0_9PEZI|nr:6-phosphogluconate dehydrogenase [Chaetomium strumarium]